MDLALGGKHGGQLVQGSAGLAGVSRPFGRVLCGHEVVSSKRNLRNYVPNPKSFRVGRGKHCRGAWARTNGIIYSVSPHRSGFFEGTGDTLHYCATRGADRRIGSGSDFHPMRTVRPNAAQPHQDTAGKAMTNRSGLRVGIVCAPEMASETASALNARHELAGRADFPFAIRHSPFALRRREAA